MGRTRQTGWSGMKVGGAAEKWGRIVNYLRSSELEKSDSYAPMPQPLPSSPSFIPFSSAECTPDLAHHQILQEPSADVPGEIDVGPERES